MNPKIDGFYSCSSHSNREKNGILTHSHMFLSGFLIMTTLGYPHWTRLRSVLPFGGCSASKGAAAGSFTARGHAVAEPHGVLPEVLGEISTLRTCWVWANNDMHMHVCEHVYTDRYNAQIYIYIYIIIYNYTYIYIMYLDLYLYFIQWYVSQLFLVSWNASVDQILLHQSFCKADSRCSALVACPDRTHRSRVFKMLKTKIKSRNANHKNISCKSNIWIIRFSLALVHLSSARVNYQKRNAQIFNFAKANDHFKIDLTSTERHFFFRNDHVHSNLWNLAQFEHVPFGPNNSLICLKT